MSLCLVGDAVAFALGYPNLGNCLQVVSFWPQRIFVPLFSRLGFESTWFPHPFAFLASFAFAISLYSFLAYCVLWLVAKARSVVTL
ncbi:MAG: hypothetical protein QOE77_241 [Blastocatellia bacterium]|nr:hypothetical protein [Blastocatellia bacterium]